MPRAKRAPAIKANDDAVEDFRAELRPDSDHTPSAIETPIQGEEGDASLQGGESGDESAGAAEAPRRKPGTFTPESARAALEKRRAKERARNELEDIPGVAPGHTVTVPIEVAKIIRRYEEDAKKGSTQAGAELRRWLEQYPPAEHRVDIEGISQADRLAILGVLTYLRQHPDGWSRVEDIALACLEEGKAEEASQIPTE